MTARRAVVEAAEQVELSDGPLAITLRRSPRARRLRVLVDPERGVVVTIPTAHSGRGAVRHVEAFLQEREPWLRRHLDRQARERTRIEARRPFEVDGVILYRGELHRLRVVAAGVAGGPDAPAPPRPGSGVRPPRPGSGVRPPRPSVLRIGGDEGDELVVSVSDGVDPRPILERWLRDRARAAVEAEIAGHAAALGVQPTGISIRDPRTRWGSASRKGRLSFSWRLILAPPAALETVVVHELAHLRVFGHGPAFWELVASRRPDHASWRRWLRGHAQELRGALGP
jgi:hypothetical protein